MGHKRNTEGLKRNATSKREDALARAERTIQEMARERGPAREPITFSSVARRAGVSRTWLYTQEELGDRIRHFRGQKNTRHDLPPKEQRASEASKDAILAALKSRIQQLEADNKELRKELEVLGGVAYGTLVSNMK